MKKKSIYMGIIISMLFVSFNTKAQEENKAKSKINVSASMVSTYIWRGGLASATPNIQPSVSIGNGNFSFGVLGSTDLAYNVAGAFKELDFFIGYSANGFSVNIYDYFWNPTAKYFDFDNETTGHIFELELVYENENIPFRISAATMLYGDDKKHSYDATETDFKKNNYSTYFELGYTFTSGNNSIYTFLGSTPFTGMYGADFNGVNLGFTANRDIKITDKFTLPIFVTAAANPQTEKVFVVVGFSL